MSKKQTIQYYSELAKSRNHTLISVSNPDTPSQGGVTIHCNCCNTDFKTSARSYKSSINGCPVCKALISSKTWKGKARILTPEESEKRTTYKKWVNETRKKRQEAYNHIQSREDLIKHLRLNNNIYNQFILDKLENPPPPGKMTEIHHIIPKHAGGPLKKWNEVVLTLEDHQKAHELRWAVYQEVSDLKATQFRKENASAETYKNIKAFKRGDETRKVKRTGIYEPGASARGGIKGGRVKSEAKDLSHQSKMSPEVYKILYQGSTWKHDKTNIIVKFGPEEVLTMPQLKDRLASVLPKGCSDKDALNASKAVNVTSNLAKVIKSERKSAYGWKLLGL